MEKVETVVRGGDVVLPTGVAARDIGIADGRILSITKPGALEGAKVIDAEGTFVVPGAIDMHVHFREPGLEYKENFLFGSAAAACGGVTVVCDMPNTSPPVVNSDAFQQKLELVQGRSWVDFALWAGGTDVRQISAMGALGAIGLKMYLNQPHHDKDPYRNELSTPDKASLRQTFEGIAPLGMLATLHVGDHAEELRLRSAYRAAGRNDAQAFCESYRGPAVVDRIRDVVNEARRSGARAHIAHISLAPMEAVQVVNRARQEGVQLSCETPPPGLLFDKLDRLGAYGAPFAFSQEESDFYWDALNSGEIDCVATDHAPHTREDKDAGWESIWSAPPGYPGVETVLPILFDRVLRGGMTLERLVAVIAENPSRLLGFSSKGRIAVGCDADLVILDPHSVSVIDERKLHSKAGWSPYHGHRLKGRIAMTILRGKVVARDGELVLDRPSGKFIPGPLVGS